MAVLVTGATGGLGQTAVRRLLAEGRDVRVLTRRPFLCARLFDSTVPQHEWHPISEPVPKEALDGVTAIVHLMGAPFAGGPARDRAERAVASRLVATRRIAEAIDGRGLRLIVASVAGLAEQPVEEGAAGRGAGESGAEPGSGDETSAPWEAEALAAAQTGSNVAIVQFGLIAAPGAVLRSLVALARFRVELDLEGATIGAIDRQDAAAMLSGLVDRADLNGRFLGVAPVSVKGEALAEALASVARQPLPVPLPLPLTRRVLTRRIGLLAPLLTATVPMMPRRLLEAGAQFQTPDPTEMLAEAVRETARQHTDVSTARWAAGIAANFGRLRPGTAGTAASAAADKPAGAPNDSGPAQTTRQNQAAPDKA